MGHKKVFPRGGEGDDPDSELLNGYLVELYEALALGHTIVDENGIAIIALPSGIITAGYMDELKERQPPSKVEDVDNES